MKNIDVPDYVEVPIQVIRRKNEMESHNDGANCRTYLKNTSWTCTWPYTAMGIGVALYYKREGEDIMAVSQQRLADQLHIQTNDHMN